MKTTKRIFSVLLALVMMLGVLATTAVSTAAAEDGTIVTIELTSKDLGIENGVLGFEASLELTGDATIEVENIEVKAPFTATVYADDTFDAYCLEKNEFVLVLTLTISGEAGETADLVVAGTYFDDPETLEDVDFSYTLTLEVIDDAALVAAIEAAEALNERDYTAESWAALETALAGATGLYENDAIAAAAKAINDAIAALVKDIDYSALNEAITAAEALTEEDYTADSWTALTTALEAAKAALTDAEDQAAVTTALINLSKAMADLKTPTETVEIPGDVETVIVTETVEVPGKGGSSTAWIVLFVIFLTLTLALAALIVVYIVLKKKKETDDTPVVDYNIEDDMMDEADDALAEESVEETAEEIAETEEIADIVESVEEAAEIAATETEVDEGDLSVDDESETEEN